MPLAGLDTVAARFPNETFHVRSDFEVEDGDDWNAAGVFHSEAFVPLERRAMAEVIRLVVASWRDAPLAQIYGLHPREAGHRPKVLLSASREAVASGVILIASERAEVEVGRGTGGVVGDSGAAETWHVSVNGAPALTSLAANETEVLLTAERLAAVINVLPLLREHLAPAGSKWEVEFGVDANNAVWIHQARKAF